MPWKSAVAVGRAYDLLRDDILNHLAILKREIGFKMLRYHAIFHDDMNVYEEDSSGKQKYNWHQLDKIFDRTIEMGYAHIVELNPMPSAIASGTETMFHYGMNVTPPSDYNKWEALVRALVGHLSDRYGVAQVSKWYFEVWNEPDLPCFWTSSMGEYFKLYEVSAKAVKSVDVNFKVGGPATSKCLWISEFLDFCHQKNVPVDFISTHLYPQDEYVLYPNRIKSPYQPGMFYIEKIKSLKEKIANSKFPDIPVFLTEWNTLSGHPKRDVAWVGNPDADGLYAASKICHLCANLDSNLDLMTWWVGSDVFEESGIPNAPFSSNYGLLSVRGTPKSSFNAFKFLSKMTGYLLEVQHEANDFPNLAGLLATCENSRIKVLLWNFVPHECAYPKLWDDTISIELPDSIKSDNPIKLIRSLLTAGNGSAYETWLKLGTPLNPSRMEEELLSAHSIPLYSVSEINTVKGEFVFNISLAPHVVLYMEISGGSRCDSPNYVNLNYLNSKLSGISA